MAVRIYGNRQIKTLAGQETRPTSSRVREALFNIWQGRVQGCRWLDLCAGSGAMGAEALCRGAVTVVGIEQSRQAYSVIRQNWQQVAQDTQTFRILRGDVRQQLKTLAGQQFDLIYFDPPYASGLYQDVLGAIAIYHLLADGGELAVEHDITHPLPDAIPHTDLSSNPEWIAQRSLAHLPPREWVPLKSCRKKTYGSTALTFYDQL